MSILCSADHFGPTCLIVRFCGQLYLHGSLSHVYIEAGSVESKDFRPGTKTSLSLLKEKLRKDAFHTGAPIPPQQTTYALPQQNSNYIPPNPTPTTAQTYSRQGQPMDLSRTRTQKTCNHCGKLGYHISRECKGECQHCHRKHPGQWCNTQPPPRRPYNSRFIDMWDFSGISKEEKEQLKKAAGF